MKAVIVFHSVCGNTYLMARAFEAGLKAEGHEVGLYRVADPAWIEKTDASAKALEVLREMRRLPEAGPAVLENAGLILLGSPTYFGNVSAQMKAFMDLTGGLWFNGRLVGKKCVAFASAGTAEGGGDLCLQAIHTYAKFMGMTSLPVPVKLVPGEGWPALGLIQYSNGKYAEAADQRVSQAIRNLCSAVSKVFA